MRNRLVEKLSNSKKGSLGYTLMEILVVVGIIVALCAIVIPSIFWLSRTLSFKQRNDYAKSIFLAAQQNLSEMRANGQLGALQSAGGLTIPSQVTDFPDEYREEYRYTYSDINGGTVSSAFELILPAGSVDGTARSNQVIIEYNPLTGNVYSVFYSEESGSIAQDYMAGTLPRDQAARRELMLGYYDGSGLNSSEIELEKTQASVEFINGEEGIVRVSVPMPDSFFGRYTEFAEAMTVDLTISGEQSLVMGGTGEAGSTSAGSFTINIKPAGDSANCRLDATGKAIEVDYVIDSLKDGMSFANFSAQDNSKSLTSFLTEDAFTVLPGDNITIQADIHFGGGVLVEVDSGILTDVNPMYERLVPSGSSGKYILYVSNGRNLQNLNAMAPSMADKVEQVVFSSDINWATTVSYYNNTIGSGTYKNSPDENPARALPYFVPIQSEDLFGTARFIYPGDNDGGLGQLLKELLGMLNSSVPTLTDELDARRADPHASIQGNGHKVYNININAPSYQVPNKGTKNEGTFYATGRNQIVDYYFNGLFAYVNTTIDDLEVVNPIVKGHGFETFKGSVYKYTSILDFLTGRPSLVTVEMDNNPATGALLGAGGYNTLITNCGAYVDRYAPGYNDGKRSTHTYSSTDTLFSDTEEQNYGVSGQGAVGGLVGYCKSHLSVQGELVNDTAYLAFSRCFAAIPVSGNMRGSTERHFGYSNGVGGLIGNSQLTNFYNCYASGDVRADGCYVERTGLGDILSILEFVGIKLELLYNGRTSMGAGGFVGSSHGTHYSNCFSTGDVTGVMAKNSAEAQGAGGFVGFMSIDENFTYGNDNPSSPSTTVAQRTVFTNCYSVGASVTGYIGRNNAVNFVPNENFSGANGRVRLKLEQSGAYRTGDYYHLYAPVYCDSNPHREPNYTDLYIYRDSYFLSGYHVTDGGQANSSNCAFPIPYDYLKNLPGSHTQNSEWTDSRIELIKQIEFRSGWFGWNRQSYNDAYFVPHPNLEGIYRDKMAEAYSSNEWEAATSSTTHPFSSSAMGAVYPFSKLKGMDYYGDWPSKPADIGMAYYETYAHDGSTTDAENTHYLFDAEHEGYANLTLKDASDGDNGQEVMVIKDGYAILSANMEALAVTVGNTSDILNRIEGQNLVINNKTYYIFPLSEKLMNAAPANGEFFLKVTASHSGGTYTMFFNPDVAMSHSNPTVGNSAIKPEVPDTISVRSARQFAALSEVLNGRTESFRVMQELHVDADLYNWSDPDAGEIRLSPIGTAEAPFSGSYLSVSDSLQMQVRNFTLEENANGIFGNLGAGSTIRNILFTTNKPITAAGDNAACVVGTSRGTLDNVDLTLTKDAAATVTATGSAGLLAGHTAGNITDCDVILNCSATLNGVHVGGLAGSAEGASGQPLALTKDTLTTAQGTRLTLNAAGTAAASGTAGGLLGSAKYVTASELTVALELMDGAADYSAALAGSAEGSAFTSSAVTLGTLENSSASGYAAGAIGLGKDTSFVSLTVTSQVIRGDKASGLLGSGDNTDVSNSSVTAASITGTTEAAGVAAVLGPQSVFDHVPLTLNGGITASNGQAAGYAIETKGEAVVQNSNVTLNGHTVSGSVCAAGYVVNLNGSVQRSGVWGSGKITGKQAAGFAANLDGKGRAASCSVTPATAETAEAYRATDNSKLTVTGTDEAAGFALALGTESSLSSCYGLGTVSAPVSAGFVLSNGGTIETCTANITITGGSAFTGTNSGTISRCYGWYQGTDDTVSEVSGKVYSAYFANLKPQDPEGKCVILYRSSGAKEELTANELSASGMDKLTTKDDGTPSGYNWFNPSADVFASMPFQELVPAKYLFPMLQNHYGNWLTPPQYAYGVAYYESYEDGSYKLHMVDLSNSSYTVEEQDMSGYAAVKTVTTEEGTTLEATFSQNNILDSTGTIQSTGYAVFRKTGTTYLDTLAPKDAKALLSLTLASRNHSYQYDFFSVTAPEGGILSIPATTASEHTAKADTRFADAIAKNGDAFAYQVRTPAQLLNLNKIPGGAVTMTHDIIGVVLGSEHTVADFSGSFTTVKGVTTLGYVSLNAPAFARISGTVTLPNVLISDMASGFITESTGTVSMGSVTVGTGASAKAGGETTAPAPAWALFGNVSNSFQTGAITLHGDAVQVFGDVSGVTTGAVTVNGKVTGQVFGNVNGSANVTGKLSVTGTANQVFGNVNASLTTLDIETGAAGKVFGEVSAKGKLDADNICVNGDVTALCGAIASGSNTHQTGSITVTGNAKQVFGDVNSGLTTGAITLGTSGKGNTADQIFGSIGQAASTAAETDPSQPSAPPASSAASVTVASITVNGDVTNRVFGDVNIPLTINGLTNVAGSVTNQVFGVIGGKLTANGITLGGSAKQIAGNIASGIDLVSTGSIQVSGTVTEKVFGTVASSLTTGTITVNALGEKAPIVSSVSGSATVTLGNVQVTTGSVGTLFGEVTGTLTGTATASTVTVGAVNGSLFAGTNNGAIQNFTVAAQSLSASLIGGAKGTDTISGITLAPTTLAENFSGSGLLIGTLPSGGTVSSCTIKEATYTVALNNTAFGGLVGTNNGAVSGSTVLANFNVNGTGTFGAAVGSNAGTLADNKVTSTIVAGTGSKTVGGLAGTSSRDITASKEASLVNVTVTYSQPENDASVLTIGALVGHMTDGTISGTPVAGSIAFTGTNSGKAYTVGGVIGKMDKGSVSNVSSSVAVGAGWAGSATSTGTVNTGNGPVGMFVGRVDNGTFTNCASTEKTNAIFAFLGEAKVDLKALAEGVVATDKEYPNGFSFDSGLNTYTTADGAPVTVTSPANGSCNYILANLLNDASTANCTFYIVEDGTAKQKIQAYGINEYYYLGGQPVHHNGYKVAETALTAGKLTQTSVTFGNATGKTIYYIKTSDGYHLMSVTRSETGFIPKKYTYTVTWDENKNEYSFSSDWYDSVRGKDIVQEFLDKYPDSSVEAIFTISQPVLDAERYLLVSENVAYKGEASAPVETPFTDRNTALSSVIWTNAEVSAFVKNSYKFEEVDADGNILYLVGGKSCQIFPVTVDSTAGYDVTAFTRHHTEADFRRQILIALPTATADDETNTPAGEAGGETQNDTP